MCLEQNSVKMAAAERAMSAIMIVKYSSLIYLTLCQYFRMELLHCEKLRKQKKELEKAEMDLVSVSQIEHEQREMQKKSTYTHTQKLSFFIQCLNICLSLLPG